ncbi:Crp/Fnr family transcriptional regulator [Chloroflexota bacterium]
MAIDTEFLKSIPYYSGLSSAELNAISNLFFEKAADKGEIILLEGEPAEALYFVVSGAVKLFKTSADGKEQILSIIRPGDSFNDVPIFDGGLSPVSTQAMTPVVLYGIKKKDLEVVLLDYPQIALNVIKVLAAQMRQLVSLVEDLSFKPVLGRVAKILLDSDGDNTAPRPRLTQQEMAAMAGTAREMIGRALKALEEDGAIKLDRHRIVITNTKALKEVAGLAA